MRVDLYFFYVFVCGWKARNAGEKLNQEVFALISQFLAYIVRQKEIILQYTVICFIPMA
jgi:hypothetical protein